MTTPVSASMSSQTQNSLLAFLASVQLALLLLFLLATTSIIGTVIPQNAPPGSYVERYGPVSARIMELLDLGDMYNSWWFLGLLTLLVVNLIACSCDRIPTLLRLLRRDTLKTTKEQLGRFRLQRVMESPLSEEELLTHLRGFFRQQGWKTRERRHGDATLLVAQKTPWSRFGAYVVHCSLLVILIGAALGSPPFTGKVLRQNNFAYKGFIMLPEGAGSDHIFSNRGNTPIDLGFTLRCDQFDIDLYENGMPRTYRSRVTVLEQGAEVLQADIEVNKPLQYRGVTFYQASYQPRQQYTLTWRKQPDNISTQRTIAPARELHWEEGGISYGIINREQRGDITRRIKLWVSDGSGEARQRWLELGREIAIDLPDGQYLVTARQVYATGLQVAKDPGVWLVYLGCLLMLAGLYIAFFLSHRQLYAFVEAQGSGSRLLFAGTANKNKVQFVSTFNRMADKLAQR